MVPELLSYLQTFWPSSLRKVDDLEVSDRLVRGLSIPEQTKQFVFAISEPESQSVVYILAAQNLSEQAALDAKCLIKEVRPEAVVAQVTPSVLIEILAEEARSNDNMAMPTSTFGVLKGCTIGKLNKETYESVAGNLVLQEIFGVGFHRHYLVAKKAAEDVGSVFFLVSPPSMNAEGDSCRELSLGNKLQALVPQQPVSALKDVDSVLSNRLCLSGDLQSELVGSMSSFLEQSDLKVASVSDFQIGEIQPRCNYQAPPFSQSIYPLLTDFNSIFVDLPSIGTALACAQKMLFAIDRGEVVDAKLLSEVHTFRLAVEGLRIALNKAGRSPSGKLHGSAITDFSKLPMSEKSHVVLAQAIRSQTRDFKSIVAIVEASSLSGLRKYWRTPVSGDFEHLVKKSIIKYDNDQERVASGTVDKKLLTENPIVAVGATAILGASSIPKLVSLTAFMKLVTFKIPMSFKLLLTYTQTAAAYGAKTTSVLKTAASAQKFRMLAHGLIASAEKNSLSIMKTAFYQIMRRKGVQPIGVMPWTTFCCSGATFGALFMYGDNIECGAESIPTASSIACLGRGIQNLHQASQEVKRANVSTRHGNMESIMYSCKKVKTKK
ncbi:hypothetical protein Vadar_011049 [Vaccinium darrowii]|uniref:Uncharacterized protein n=1 Tax=Vaccinium darrowii TaxID=229202 RepID=A0ACB7YUM4_9ERIC|nr:hypothetical protein Vadar_011049 [Vaccinium darrowii]